MARLLPFRGSEANRPLDPEGAEGVGRQQLRIAGPRRRGVEQAGADEAREMLVRQILAEQRQAIAAVLRLQRNPAAQQSVSRLGRIRIAIAEQRLRAPGDRKSTRLNSSTSCASRMPASDLKTTQVITT